MSLLDVLELLDFPLAELLDEGLLELDLSFWMLEELIESIEVLDVGLLELEAGLLELETVF